MVELVMNIRAKDDGILCFLHRYSDEVSNIIPLYLSLVVLCY